jgi:hypothetical protein
MDDLGKSIPAAEVMVDSEQGTKSSRSNDNCLNCGTPLTDAYCAHCGQKDLPRRQTLGDMLTNFISSFWSYEGKFFRTTRYIITSPGFLAKEYTAGRRESYYHPARMYVFISFVFFLIFFSLPEEQDTTVEMDKDDIEDLREDMRAFGLDSVPQWQELSDSAVVAWAPAIQDSLRKREKKGDGSFSLQSSDFETVEQYDSAQLAKAPDDRDGWFVRRLKVRSIELNEKYKDQRGKFGEDFGQLFQDNFSKVLFWLLPFFALVLKLLYIRRDFYYSEHLVLTIYYYNFFFLAASVMMLIGLIPGLGFVQVILGFWIYFYLLFSMKHMYGQDWSKTILKFMAFSFLFSVFIIAGFMVSTLWILMFM